MPDQVRSLLFLLPLLALVSGCDPVLSSKQYQSGKDLAGGVIYSLARSVTTVKIKLGSTAVLDAAAQKEKKKLEAGIAKSKGDIKTAKGDAKAKLEAALKKQQAELQKLIADAPKVRALRLLPGVESVLADPDAEFVLSYNHSYNSDDTVEIKTTENGLLKSISSTAKDQTGEAISLVVKAVADAGVFVASGGLSGLAKRDVTPRDDEKPDPCLTEPDYEVDVLVDPSDPKTAFETIRAAVKAKTGLECLQMEVRNHKAKLVYASSPAKPVTEPEKTLKTLTSRADANTSAAKEHCEKGACYRRKGSVFFQLQHKDARVVSMTTQLSAPQLGALGWIDFARREFVETKAEAEFVNGSLVKLKLTKPSELLAFVNIPVEILETIFGIPSKLFETESGRLEGRAKVIEAETGLIESRIKLLEQQKLETETITPE